MVQLQRFIEDTQAKSLKLPHNIPNIASVLQQCSESVCKGKALQQLSTLDISGNTTTEPETLSHFLGTYPLYTGLTHFLLLGALPALKHLELRDMGLTNAHMENLAISTQNGGLRAVQTLVLEGNPELGPDKVAQVVRNMLNLQNVSVLSLKFSNVAVKGTFDTSCWGLI